MAIGNVKGGPFEDWVTNQIEQREISLGKGSGENPKDLLYQQSKTPWLRLASSVNIKATTSYGTLDRLLTLPGINRSEIEGIQAARNFILQGGAVSLKENSLGFSLDGETNSDINLNSGLNTTAQFTSNANNLSGAYGWGGTTERGLVQFALVDALYMRPGYTLLLEFGWSAYLQTNDQDRLLTGDEVKLETSDPFFTPALSLLLNPENKSQRNQYKIIQKIKEERKRTSGNYEAVFGKIVNFKWSIDPDGSYNCAVDLRGLGEVIESLKINVNTNTEESSPEHFTNFDVNGDGLINQADENEIEYLSIVSGRDKADLVEDMKSRSIPLVALGQSGGTLVQNLYAIYQMTKSATGANQTDWLDLEQDATGADKVMDYSIKNFPIVSNNGDFFKKNITFKNGILGLVGTETDDYIFTPQIYVKFGLLLALIQKNIVPTNGKNGPPIFTFDMQFDNLEKDKNYIRRLQGQFPINPQHYMIPYSNHNLNDLEIKYLTEILNLPTNYPKQGDCSSFNRLFKGKSGSGWKYNSGLGRLANVYVNVNRVGTILLEQKGTINSIQKNEKDLFEFLKILLDEININLGGINNVRLKLPDEGARVRFVEDIPQTFGGAPPINYKNKLCKFTTFGFTNNVIGDRKGSIVRNLGIDASIPSNFSTMISIGAQPNGNQLSGNATSFSNYNTGIIDRVIPMKSLITSTAEPENPLEVQFKELAGVVNGLLNQGWWDSTWLGSSLNTDGGLFADVFRDRNWYGDDMVAFRSLGTSYHQLLNGIYTQEPSKGGTGTLNAPFFLPFNLTLDIDGMSGIVMMQRFDIDQKVLPPSYDKDSVEIIVKSVDHTISVDSWVTKLGTQSVPKIKIRKSSGGKNTTGGSGSATSGQTYSNYSVKQANRDIDGVNAKTRMRLTLVEDMEYATLCVLEILAVDEITVIGTYAAKISRQDAAKALYRGDDRFLCVRDISQKFDAIFLIGNSKNGYEYNNLYNSGDNNNISRGEVVKNVLMCADTIGPYGFSKSESGVNIWVGDGFQSSHPKSQIKESYTGLGPYFNDLNNSNYNLTEFNLALALPGGIEGVKNWYMDMRDITSDTASGATFTQSGLSNSEIKKQRVVTFSNKLMRISPAARALWTKWNGFDWENSDKEKDAEIKKSTNILFKTAMINFQSQGANK